MDEEEEEDDYLGIVSSHSYSILDCREVVGSDGEKDKILQLRNPWGKYEWKGDWSDYSDKWTKSLKKMLNLEQQDDGIFWINVKDFCDEFA